MWNLVFPRLLVADVRYFKCAKNALSSDNIQKRFLYITVK